MAHISCSCSYTRLALPLNEMISTLSVYSETWRAASSSRSSFLSLRFSRTGMYLALSVNHSPIAASSTCGSFLVFSPTSMTSSSSSFSSSLLDRRAFFCGACLDDEESVVALMTVAIFLLGCSRRFPRRCRALKQTSQKTSWQTSHRTSCG